MINDDEVLFVYTNLFKILAISVLALCFGCTGDTPTSPSYEYSGNWSGSWKDYTSIFSNTGNPFGSHNLLIVIENDGTGYGKGKMELTVGGRLLIDQLEMWVEVLPDGAVTGRGVWTFYYRTQYVNEGRVVGQLNSDTEEGNGAVIIKWNGLDWNFPWEVKKEK